MSEIAETIARQRDISVEDALTLVEAAEGFWAALGALGFVDGYGGSEFSSPRPSSTGSRTASLDPDQDQDEKSSFTARGARATR
jgi:hypothetical protein